ncbi:putative quinol monooxygenase [Streptomyces tsukubensis]|uniref:Antibiotic biosynthesis monooxygenase n=1 Tax=Streptomyces tsukubensis TaxID=83656 RepID=A0A1V4A9Y7_9ACTN|nr:putative quinol monooxygenase [Streptomyces tsukubensis]OON79655.1 antibiotic biosynthesis monooxygenase [Streptomyces tsukubensis]QFR95841.1 antibiotic biosynthesis monooxygenase [Streptomyces tsukubensis]
MIFIAVRFTVRPHHSDQWLTMTKEFTEATRAEEGNVFFDWSRDTENPHRFVLLEAFASPEAGRRHVESDHFRTAMSWMPDIVESTPEIINVETPETGWSAMSEVTPR